MPWEWDDAPTYWMPRLEMWLNARMRASQPRQQMTVEQVAPFAMSKEDAEAHLRAIGAIA